MDYQLSPGFRRRQRYSNCSMVTTRRTTSPLTNAAPLSLVRPSGTAEQGEGWVSNFEYTQQTRSPVWCLVPSGLLNTRRANGRLTSCALHRDEVEPGLLLESVMTCGFAAGDGNTLKSAPLELRFRTEYTPCACKQLVPALSGVIPERRSGMSIAQNWVHEIFRAKSEVSARGNHARRTKRKCGG